MSYELYRLSEFTSNPLYENAQGENYYIEILKKDYTGDHRNVIAGAVPVIHSCQTDDPVAPIKGSAVDIVLLNKDGLNPLQDYFSIEDDTFKVNVRWGDTYDTSSILFTGFLVQDDCTEDLLDVTHAIQLKATDNLGLLKDIDLGEAAVKFGERSDYTVTLTYGSAAQPIGGLTIDSLIVDIQAGDELTIGYPIYAEPRTFTVTSAVFVGATTQVDIEPDIYFFSTVLTTITVNRPVLLTEKLALADILRLCLLSTGLELNTKLYSALMPTGGTEDSFITATFVEVETFLSNKKWDSCYEVLEAIMKDFKASIEQVYGDWVIIRQDERKYYNNAIPGIEYNSDFEYVGDIELDNIFTAGIGEDTRAQTVLQQSIQRGYKYAKETFLYNQPANLLKNIDFQTLGNLRTSFVVGANTHYEYDMPDWYDGDAGNLGLWFITVVKNTTTGEEVERYASVDNSGVFPSVVRSTAVEVSAGDTIKFSFDFRTTGSQVSNGAVYADFRFELEYSATPATHYRRMKNDGTWNTSPYFRYYWSNGTNTNTWNTVEANSVEIPFDGLLFIYLAQADYQGGDTQYKNLRFTVTHPINGSSKVIGHTHTDTQNVQIKNVEDIDRKIDDSPSNPIAGTLFLSTTPVLIRSRTTTWNVGTELPTPLKLGNITTFDTLFRRRKPRSILNGTLRGLQQNSIHLSLLTLIRYNYFTLNNYAFGRCEIDYKNNSVAGTLYEIFSDDEPADLTVLAEVYEFKYLYEK